MTVEFKCGNCIYYGDCTKQQADTCDYSEMLEVNSVNKQDALILMEEVYDTFGKESVDLILCDLPYTFKGKNRVTANTWDTPIDIDEFFHWARLILKPNGVMCLTATNPFASHLITKGMDMYKYDWVWEKDNGSNFVHVKHQPFKVHEYVLVFGKGATTYTKKGNYMNYDPQFTYSKPYTMKRDGSDVENLVGFKGRTDTSNEDGKRYPRSVQKFNLERGFHPTQKPVPLFEYLIKTYTNEGDLVLDVCCGSGTTAVASKKSNRKYIVGDLEDKYLEITKNRLKELE